MQPSIRWVIMWNADCSRGAEVCSCEPTAVSIGHPVPTGEHKVGEGAAAGALENENDALGILRRVLVHHAKQLCCLHFRLQTAPDMPMQAWVVGEQLGISVPVECSAVGDIALVTNVREISSSREQGVAVSSSSGHRGAPRVKNEKDIVAVAAPVRLKEGLRERQLPASILSLILVMLHCARVRVVGIVCHHAAHAPLDLLEPLAALFVRRGLFQ
jgi:hypothetical protein